MVKLWPILTAFVLLIWGHPASAHLTPNSELRLHETAKGLEVAIIVPAAEYRYATGNPVADDAESRALARQYLATRLAVTQADGRALKPNIAQVHFATVEGPRDLFATAFVAWPDEQPPSEISLRWSAVIGEVPDHFALVVLDLGDSRRVVGSLRQNEQGLRVDFRQSRGEGVLNAIRIGAEHIIGGFDHLLFLLALLISAPLVADKGRWVGIVGPRPALLRLMKVTTGFTIGHSMTLILAGLSNLALPVAPVEALIALSVLVTALHAIRPVFPGNEAIMATGFGLVHGLAFATLAAGAEGRPAQNLPSLLGFNLGIELVQLAVLAIALPALFWIMRSDRFSAIRTGAGGLVAICGTVWLAQRLPSVFI